MDAIDDREQVTNTSEFPWNLVSILYIQFDDGTFGQCTGTLVSPHVIITVGHCLHARDKGGFVKSVSAAPGQIQRNAFGAVQQPNGERFAQYTVVTERWKRISGGGTHPISDYAFDYAALFFERSWSFTDTFMPIVFDDPRGPVNNAGYPGSVRDNRGNQGMWHDFGPETANSNSFWRNFQVREFELDSSGGNSGGPFWIYDGTNSELTGILSYGVADEEITGGPWIGGNNEDTIRSWANWEPGDPVPSSEKPGARLTIAFGSEYEVVSSFLRFYNASASAGRVKLTISSAATGNTIGTWSSPIIQPLAAPQFAIDTIEDEARQLVDKEGLYAIAVESDFDGFVQHVLWNRGGESLTNMTACEAGLSSDVSTITNFHSSLLADGYESFLFLHNVGESEADVRLAIYDSARGDRIGGILWPDVPPDGTFLTTSTDIDEFLDEFYDHQPANGQYHYNIKIENDFPGYIQHMVVNSGAGVFTNMAAKCPLNAS